MGKGTPPAVIVVSETASWLERLAALEVRRYLYLRTGQLLPIQHGLPNGNADVILLARSDRLLESDLLPKETLELYRDSLRERIQRAGTHG